MREIKFRAWSDLKELIEGVCVLVFLLFFMYLMFSSM